MKKNGILILLMLNLSFIACNSGGSHSKILTKEQIDSITVAKFYDMANGFFANPVSDLDHVPNDKSLIVLSSDIFQGMTLTECIDRWGPPSYCIPYNDCGEARCKPKENFFTMCLEQEYPLYVSKEYSHIFAHWDVNIKQFGGLDVEFVVIGNQAYAFAAYLFTSWNDDAFWELPCG